MKYGVYRVLRDWNRSTPNLLCCSVNLLVLGSDFFLQFTDEWLFVLELIFLRLLLLLQTLRGIVHLLEMESRKQKHKHTWALKCGAQRHARIFESAGEDRSELSSRFVHHLSEVLVCYWGGERRWDWRAEVNCLCLVPSTLSVCTVLSGSAWSLLTHPSSCIKVLHVTQCAFVPACVSCPALLFLFCCLDLLPGLDLYRLSQVS